VSNAINVTKAVSLVQLNNLYHIILSMKQAIALVDLHIEKIAKGYRSFAPADSLKYQLDFFERTLQANKTQKGKKIDFVHGSGTGTLRNELIKVLNQKFPSYTYEDASFAMFGYQGAIRVTIK
jgi:hypothetical protein